ncbi:unnamed protein product [Pleuronectes platessa]|uniref:Uncharacterized protein n=1 Tax=Pleuronectes platessa TaxID=8262 RepID=A0A9N7VY34_PLEPL|nr:unnamed protein product [Pleuronectes platessa]
MNVLPEEGAQTLLISNWAVSATDSLSSLTEPSCLRPCEQKASVWAGGSNTFISSPSHVFAVELVHRPPESKNPSWSVDTGPSQHIENARGLSLTEGPLQEAGTCGQELLEQDEDPVWRSHLDETRGCSSGVSQHK